MNHHGRIDCIRCCISICTYIVLRFVFFSSKQFCAQTTLCLLNNFVWNEEEFCSIWPFCGIFLQFTQWFASICPFCYFAWLILPKYCVFVERFCLLLILSQCSARSIQIFIFGSIVSEFSAKNFIIFPKILSWCTWQVAACIMCIFCVLLKDSNKLSCLVNTVYFDLSNVRLLDRSP